MLDRSSTSWEPLSQVGTAPSLQSHLADTAPSGAQIPVHDVRSGLHVL